MNRAARLNALAKAIDAKRYLEIGVCKGATFLAVDIPFKVAVDPRFQFDIAAHAAEGSHYHEVVSDEFFCKIAKTYPPFDLIYLDGLHTFEQTFRDFCASMAYAHPRTVWLIDDTCPTNLAAAEPSLQRWAMLKKRLDIASASWMGDVYKLVCAIHDFFPQMSFATFPHHGQTVVWHQPREDFAPRWNSLKAISELGYADFVELSDSLFKRTAYEPLINQVREAYAGLAIPADVSAGDSGTSV